MNNLFLSTTNACEVIRENFPVFFKNNMSSVIDVCVKNEEWCDRLTEKSEEDLLFLSDVAHDIRGLSLSSDDHFLPRI